MIGCSKMDLPQNIEFFTGEKMTKSKCQWQKTLMCICLVLCFFGCASSNKKQSKDNSEADKYQLAMGFNNLGANYVNKDMPDEAIVQFKRALTIKPDLTEARNNLGVAFCRQKMFDDAIAEFKLAIKINPDYSKAHDNLGFAYRNKNMFNEAIAEHNLALKINLVFFVLSQKRIKSLFRILKNIFFFSA